MNVKIVKEKVAGSTRRRRFGFPAFSKEALTFFDVDTLSRYVSQGGKIIPRRISLVSAKKQRQVARLIRQARHLSLMRYTNLAGTSGRGNY